jgi:hypothetical protein
MRKWWPYAVLALALVVGGYFAVGWLRTNALRTLMMTTADPDALGLVTSDSMQPITLTLESDHLAQDAGPGPRVPTNQRISFKIPAAYLNVIDLKEGRSGSQRIGFEVWSRTFDPVALDVIADHRKCRVGVPCYAEPTDRSVQRKRDGESRLQIQIGNAIGTEARRIYILNNLDGLQTKKKPCKITEDAELGMLVAETPDGLRPNDACNFIGNPGIRTRDGKSFPPKNFLKRKPDGTPEFVVHCHNFSSEKEEQAEINCKLYAYFGIWPLSIQFWGIEPKEWSDIYERVQKFLTMYVIERTN